MFCQDVSKVVKQSAPRSDLEWELSRRAIRHAMELTSSMRTKDRHRLVLHAVHVQAAS